MPSLSHRVPLIAAALFVVFVNFSLLRARVSHPQPNSPWEAGLVVDASRIAHGLPVYEDPRAGHATTMYGPLAAAALAAVFKLTGANNYAGRLFELICGLVAVTLLAWALLRGQPPTTLLVGWAILLCVNVRSGNWFADTRPDAACLFFSVLALLLAYRDSWASFAASLFALVCAFYFKQTAVAAAAAIALACVLTRGRVRLWWLKAAATLAVLPLAILATRAFFPLVYYYMITVPAANPIQTPRLYLVPLALLASVPLFHVALFEWLSSGERLDKRGAWLSSAVACAFLYSVVSTARDGGGINSLMPAVAALLAFAVWRLPQLLAPADPARLSHARRLLHTSALAVALVVTGLYSYEDALAITLATHGDEHYASAVEVARALPGKVVSPNDPTIPLYAKGYAGRQIFMEVDAGMRIGVVPDYALDELQTADYVVQVNKPLVIQFIPDSRLEAAGFRPLDYPELRGTAYTVWAAKR